MAALAEAAEARQLEGRVVHETNTPLHACSIETLVPRERLIGSAGAIGEESKELFLCGLYELKEEDKVRDGAILVCESLSDGEVVVRQDLRLDGGVLDLKVDGSFSRCAAALSTSKLMVYDLAEVGAGLSLVGSTEDPDEGLFLSVDWSNRLQPAQSEVSIAVSTQQGSVLVYGLGPAGLDETLRLSNVHSQFGENMPAWIVAFNSHDNSVLLSGGDDLTMRLWDLRSGSAIHKDSRTHTAGVTSAQWHPREAHLFATGSYDENLRIWDQRALRTPLATLHTGGGVWRTKWLLGPDPADCHIVVSCMQGGTGVFRLDSDNSFDELAHTSYLDSRNPQHLAYGVDVLRLDPSTSTLRLASCSFYDNLLQILDFPLSRPPSK